MGNMGIKNLFILSYILLFLIIILPNATSLRTEIPSESICVHSSDELNFDIQFKPELNAIYASLYNPFNEDVKNLTFSLALYDSQTNKVLDEVKYGPVNIKPKNFDCILFQNIKFSYNIPINILFWRLEYYKNGEKAVFHSVPINNTIFLSKCLDINQWNRKKEILFYGGSNVNDNIIFKKICNNTFFLNLKFYDIEMAHIPLFKAYINTNGKKQLKIYSPPNSNLIGIEIPEDLPLDELLELNINYYLPPIVNRPRNFYFLYPFSSWFYNLGTIDITLGEIYLSFTNKSRENISDIDLYTIESILPKGLSSPSEPAELFHDELLDKPVLEDSGGMVIFYPNLGCIALKLNEFPKECLKIIPIPTPKEDKSLGKIIWSTPIINEKPNKFSFYINEDPLFRFIYIIFMIVSVFLFFILFKKKGFLVSSLTYASVYLLIRLALPIPFVITLFDITALIFILILPSMIYFIKVVYSNRDQIKNRMNIVRLWVINKKNRVSFKFRVYKNLIAKKKDNIIKEMKFWKKLKFWWKEKK